MNNPFIAILILAFLGWRIYYLVNLKSLRLVRVKNPGKTTVKHKNRGDYIKSMKSRLWLGIIVLIVIAFLMYFWMVNEEKILDDLRPGLLLTLTVILIFIIVYRIYKLYFIQNDQLLTDDILACSECGWEVPKSSSKCPNCNRTIYK